MKNYIVILLLMLIGANNLHAQKTIEKIGKAAEVVNTAGNVIKSLGLFNKKNKKTDSLSKQEKANNPAVNKEANTAVNEAKVIDKNFVAKIVFGKQKNETEILWKANEYEKIDEEFASQLLSEDGYYHSVVDELIEFEDKGIENVTAILLTYNYNKDEKGKLRKNESRAASPGIGFANFNKTEDGTWQLLKIIRLADRVGSDGEIPDFEKVDLGATLNCISFTESYGQGGQNETQQSFYALNADYLGKKVFKIALLESYEGGYTKNNPAYEITRTFKILENNIGNDYPDILVNGIKNKKNLPMILYAFSKEKVEYVLKNKPIVTKTAAKQTTIKKVASTPVKKAATPTVKPKSTVKTASTPGAKNN